MSRFRNPTNGYEEDTDSAGVWCFLFGCFYFAAKGVWSHAIISAALAIMTSGVSWLLYPFFAQRVMTTHFLRRGWIVVAAAPAMPALPLPQPAPIPTPSLAAPAVVAAGPPAAAATANATQVNGWLLAIVFGLGAVLLGVILGLISH